MKKNLLILILILVVIGISYFEFSKRVPTYKVADADLCYVFMENKDDGSFDEYKLRFSIKDSQVLGNLEFLPSEKDKKTGSIEGTVIKPISDKEAYRADLWWTASAEGRTVKEELKIIFGDGTASIGLGEMIEGEDGIYKYKSIPEIVYGIVLYQTPCVE